MLQNDQLIELTPDTLCEITYYCRSEGPPTATMLLTVQQVADRFQVSIGKVYDLIRRRELRSTRIGDRGPIRIPWDALQELEQANMTGPKPLAQRPAATARLKHLR